MDDYEEEEYFEEEIEEVETFEQETSYYVNLVNIPLDEYTIENKEFESYVFDVNKSDKDYLQYDVENFIKFIKDILEDCPQLVENYIDEYDNFNEELKQYPVWFLIFINPEFTEKEMKLLVNNCRFVEPITCFDILSQMENTDEDPYYYINLYVKVWNAFDLYNSPIKSKIIDHIQKQYFINKNGQYDYPCMVEFLKIVLSLDIGKKPTPSYIIPYENNENINLKFEKIPLPEIPVDIVDQLVVCDEDQLKNIDIDFEFAKTPTEIEFIKLFGPINKCNIPTKDEKYGGGCRMLTCNCFEYDEADNASDYFYDESCRLCNVEIKDRRNVIRLPLVNGGWLGCYCCYECALIGIDQLYYSDIEKKIMKKILAFNYKLITMYKIYDNIPDIVFE